MSLYDETLSILKKFKLQANKALGQNFLVDENVVNSIIESANISKDDLVIEIGPGLGVLTKLLLEKAYKVIAIELDNNMVNIIKDRFKEENDEHFTIVNEDVLKVDINKLIEDAKQTALNNNCKIENVKVVANLPYYISTPIVMKLLENKLNIDSLTIMVQKEVAQRLIAIPGTKFSGSITYVVNYYATAESVLNVKKECFIPPPNVESEVIKLTIRKSKEVEVDDEKKLFDFIQLVFSQRRKTLANVLVNLKYVENKEKAQDILNRIGLNDSVRGESLTLEKFTELEKLLEF